MMPLSSGVLNPSLKIGVIAGVNAKGITLNLTKAGLKSASYHHGGRYGRGEVGEVVLIEGQTGLTLGKILDVRLPEKERQGLSNVNCGDGIDAIGYMQVLGSVCLSSLAVSAGVTTYPRIGDSVYSAPVEFIAKLPELSDKSRSGDQTRLVNLGSITDGITSDVAISPEKLFGRHCAILGSTGGGKSWTTSRLIQECAKFTNSKVIVLDATGEYRSLPSTYTMHRHLGKPLNVHKNSTSFRIPPTDFVESDFLTLFEPSGKVQGPKLREAIRSLRLVHLDSSVSENGVLMKINRSKEAFRASMRKRDQVSNLPFSALVDLPSQPFDVKKLIRQIEQECCWSNNDSWGNPTNDLGYCSSLFTRIQSVLKSPSFEVVFEETEADSLSTVLDEFLDSPYRVLRLCLSATSYEFNAREILANVIGRKLLSYARSERFTSRPLLTVVDEAHNFLGKKVGFEEYAIRLDAFEIIAKEGRKYGLNICLTTQRPRDITEGVISQMGTLLVHRLTNSNDRELVERACGEVDKSMIEFLPNLKQGELAVVGVDFPIPLTIQVHKPEQPPLSDSPSYQMCW
ncbi:Cell division protein FtsK [Vibrio chagasii]|uniref:ATP-binding protein n=1 Tax=Vibrio chagasii TaxID=170679 RepID=UPI00337297A2|nr:Cell division protein FtsK [Vibrio chagasii]CAH7330169.1 Cell division protein FtsK [Vibrio chagasii]CAH7374865.1 Cell division protein FtsK [Vibrio chagasii]